MYGVEINRKVVEPYRGVALLALGYWMKPIREEWPKIVGNEAKRRPTKLLHRTRARSELSATAQRTLLTGASRDDGRAPVINMPLNKTAPR